MDIIFKNLEIELKTNANQVFVNYEQSFQDSKQKFYTEFGSSFEDRTHKNNLQKDVLISLTNNIKILSQLINKFNKINPDKILGGNLLLNSNRQENVYHSPKMSPILSIVTEMIIWTSDKFIELLDRFDYVINDLQKHISTRPATYDIIAPIVLETIKSERIALEQQFTPLKI